MVCRKASFQVTRKPELLKFKPIGLMSPRIKKERRLIYEVVS